MMNKFGTMAIILILFAIATFKLLRHEEPKIENVKLKDQVTSLTKDVIAAAKNNKNIMIGWIIVMFCGGPMVIFEIYIMNWL